MCEVTGGSTAADYRAKGDEARRNAEAASDATTRQDWLDIATGYDLLAEAAEAQAKQMPGRW